MISLVHEEGKLWTKIQGEHVVVPKLEQTLEWILTSPPDYHSFDELPVIVDTTISEENAPLAYEANLAKEIETANAADKPVLTELKEKLSAYHKDVAEYDAKDKAGWDKFAAEQGVIYNDNRPIAEELDAEDAGKLMTEFDMWVVEFTKDYKAKAAANPELGLSKTLMKTLIAERHRELQDELVKYGEFDYQNDINFPKLTVKDFEQFDKEEEKPEKNPSVQQSN